MIPKYCFAYPLLTLLVFIAIGGCLDSSKVEEGNHEIKDKNDYLANKLVDIITCAWYIFP